jgi:hypothetical protein
VEEGGFLYDSDACNGDSPYFVDVVGKRHLVVPYTPDVNDFCFWNSPGFFQSEDFYSCVYFLVTGITGLSILGISTFVQNLFYGGALVIAVTLSQIVRGREEHLT